MISGLEVTLDEMLKARDRRAARQRAHTAQALVSLTLNIAGPVKRFPLADQAFEVAKQSIAARLGETARLLEASVDEAGHWALFAADMDAAACKEQMRDIEQNHPIGRLFDIDVTSPDGIKLGRAEPRKCLLCDQPAHACARSRAHPVEALQAATLKWLKGYFDAVFARSIQAAASRALLQELSATPKPGLVDRENSGSHRDMDYASFLDSIEAISTSFSECALLGMEVRTDRALFAALKSAGMRAEADMLAATGGANTHRGAIFALGLLSASCGRLYARDARLASDAVCAEAAKWGAMFHAERCQNAPSRLASHGERAYAEHGAGGARAEAMAGYPSVCKVALPALRKWLERGASSNDASVCALLALIAEVEDTNLIARGGIESAAAVRATVCRRMASSGDDLTAQLDLARALDAEFIKAGLSPGGCADLLAAAWMLHFLEGGS